MEDMERYGDYNEVDDEPRRHGALGIVIKVLIALVCVLVIGIMGFRIFIFNSYPKEVSRLIYSDALKEHYEATGGDIGAMTQQPNFRYDDPNEGNFFFDELIVVPSADHLQVTVRYNTSLMESIKTKYGVELDPDADPFDIFEFRLARTRTGYVQGDGENDEKVPVETVGTLGATKTAKSFMYRYARVAFDGVDLGLDEGETPVGWYRLEITVKGVENMEPYKLAVYQHSIELEDYELDRSEVPEK